MFPVSGIGRFRKNCPGYAQRSGGHGVAVGGEVEVGAVSGVFVGTAALDGGRAVEVGTPSGDAA